MAGVTSVEVKETLEAITEQLKQAKGTLTKEKLQMLYWLKQDKPLKVNKIAEALGRHRSTVQRWLSIYKKEGLEELLKEREKRQGAPRKIPQWAENALNKRLKEEGNGFKSYKEVQQWLEEELGVEAKYKTVHYMTRYRLKAKLKVVRPQNSKQDKEQKEAFKKTLGRI